MAAAGDTVGTGTGCEATGIPNAGAAGYTIGTGGTGAAGVGYTVGPGGGGAEYAIGWAGAGVGYANGTPGGTGNTVAVDTVGAAEVGTSKGAIGV